MKTYPDDTWDYNAYIDSPDKTIFLAYSDAECIGQIEAGVAIIGFYEDIGGSVLDKYINSSMATKAIKL